MDKPKTYTLSELSVLLKAELIGNPNHVISGVESLEAAGPEDASFLANLKYKEAMRSSNAGVICVPRDLPLIEGKNVLICENPSRAFQFIIELFLSSKYDQSGFTGIHPTAVIHPTAKIGQDVHIGPYCVIDQGVIIGDRTRLAAYVFIGAGTSIGQDCLFNPHVTVREKCQIHDRVILQPGAVIGSCGFGYTTDAKGQHTKLEQRGNVILENDVEVGANTTIDRGRFKNTCISTGSKIDNLVQIGHNATLGPHNIIIAQTGISGSVKTGRNVVMGGQAGAVGHIEIADFVMIATRGGVSKSITEPGKYGGGPLMPLLEHHRMQVHMRKIPEYLKQIEKLEKRLEELEKATSQKS